MNRVTDISEALLISFHISDLKPNLQRELLVAKPTALGEVFEFEHVTEARLVDQQSGTVLTTIATSNMGQPRQATPCFSGLKPDVDGDDTGQDMEADAMDVVESGSGDVHVLIDNRSTHNFVQPDIVERMCLPVQMTKAFKVYIGSEEFLLCENVCSQTTLSMQGLTMEVDIYVLPMKGPALVLGIQWMQKLGKVTHDYAQQTMKFTLVNTKYSLQRDELLQMKKISLHRMQSLRETEDVYGVYEFHSLPMEAEGVAIAPKVAKPVHPKLEQLLTRFDSLFQEHQFYVKRSKCVFGVATLEYLGHIILRHGVEMDPKKVSAVHEWPDGFKWEDRESEAFEALKQRLSTAPEENKTLEELLDLDQQLDWGDVAAGFRREGGMVIFQDCYFIGAKSKLKSLLSQGRGASRSFCQPTKYSTQESGGYLQPFPAPTAVWEDVSMDFLTGMPLSMGFPVVLVVVDRFTKYAHFDTLPTSFNAHKVAKVFVETVVKHHGIPKTIVSDRDPIFLASFGHNFLNLAVIFLPWAEYCYNTSYHNSIKMTPYQALYGTYPPGSSKVAVVEDMLVERDELLRLLRENLLAAKNRMEKKANLKRRKVEFNVGDKVLIKLQPYRQLTLAKRLSHKLAKRSPEEATWEFVSKFQAAYPAYDLEDKVIYEEEGNDTPGSLEAGREKRVSVTPKWHKDFVIRYDNYHHTLSLSLCY
ncbi:ty3-gypsy retrotransposon protein [Tanacetum coccineum]